jgi:AsmA protein
MVKTAPPLTVSGTADLNIPSVRNLAAWAGNPVAMQGNNLGPLLVKGKVAVNGAKYAFTDATVNLDAIKTKGSVEFDGSGSRPYLKAALDVEMLDLNPYLPPEQSGGQTKPATSTAPTAPKGNSEAKPDDWSDEPIDFAGLRAADADLALGVGGIKVRKIEVGRSALKVALKGGRMTADLTELNLYDGKGSGQVVLDGSSSAAGLQSNFKLAGLQIAPLLTAAADLGMVTGKGAIDIDITSKGGTQRQLVSALNGKGGLKINDGTVKGIDFVRMLCDPTQAIQVLGGKIDPNAKTDFSEMGLTYSVTNGLLRNQDLAVVAPLFRAEGSGTVDLPKRAINYRAVPKLVASCSGQGGDAGKVGLGLPVIVEGPWSNVSVRPDFNPMDILKSVNPAEALKDPKGALKGLLPGTGGTQPPPTGGQTQQQPAPGGGVGGAVKGLIGR